MRVPVWVGCVNSSKVSPIDIDATDVNIFGTVAYINKIKGCTHMQNDVQNVDNRLEFFCLVLDYKESEDLLEVFTSRNGVGSEKTFNVGRDFYLDTYIKGWFKEHKAKFVLVKGTKIKDSKSLREFVELNGGTLMGVDQQK